MELHKLSLIELSELLDKGEVTSYQLVRYFLTRIEQYDMQGPKVNAVLEINPEALQIAKARDIERVNGEKNSYLHGIPILIKDNISTDDMNHTSGGSLALAESYALRDSFVAQKLREAGAIILGKANMTEWANFMAKNMTNGYSSRGGQVKNPYGLDCFDVGGSSSGSAASVASGMVPISIGTETFGSILSPAANNMLVGIKPTVGLVSRSGIIPISPAQDVAGPITKTVKDAAILLQSIAGYDPEDEVTKSSVYVNTDYLRDIEDASLEGKRFGVLRTAFEKLDPARVKLINKAINECKELGAEIIDDLEIKDADSLDLLPLIYEFKPALNSYLENYTNTEIRNLADVIRFNHSNRNTLEFGQYYLIEAESTSGTLTESKYIKTKLRDLEICKDGLDKLIISNEIDALILPGNYGSGITARAGYPSITIPSGKTEDNRPFGITFSGLPFSEKQLIEIAYAYEKSTKHREWPLFDTPRSC
ncbi:MAG: amidase family protein [Clostridia bacterium]